ncbi:Putative nuclease [Frankliniella fusca]|uniref:Nuclease n=1 Tax=Frankliniella fusca TaxID=407009 RepID=A0AAE1HKN7_9NEOP|nr:Putative nuclease [Frankliniella fusca]
MRFRRDLRLTNDPFAISVTLFRSLYRMPQHCVMELANIIRPHMPPRLGHLYLSVEIKLLCALIFYGHGPYQRPHSRMADLNLSQSSVSNAIRDVTNALNSHDILMRFIHFPTTLQERNLVINRNARLGLPRVLGFIDGTLIKIHSPSGPDKYVYRSRKGYTALNVQIVCDSDLRILSINSKFPGSATDPWIYRMTPVRHMMRQIFQEDPCWLLGDSAYPHEPWLQKPILHALPGTPEARYTMLHNRSRNCVERCIGVRKGTWRCLMTDRTLHYQPVKAGQIVNACAVLHNYLRQFNKPLPFPVAEDFGEDQDDLQLHEQGLMQQAEVVRNFLIQAANEYFINNV